MIRDYLSEVQQRDVSDMQGVYAQNEIIEAFERGMAALQDPEVVDCPRVNIIAGTVGKLLAANAFDVRVLPTAPPEAHRYPGSLFSMGRMRTGYERGELVLMPDYHQRVYRAPLLELGALARVTEFARGRLGAPRVPPPELVVRSEALESELLRHITAEEPLLRNFLHPNQLDIMNEFPKGFESIGSSRSYWGVDVMPVPVGLTTEERNDVADLEATLILAPTPAELHGTIVNLHKEGWPFVRLEAVLQSVGSRLSLRAIRPNNMRGDKWRFAPEVRSMLVGQMPVPDQEYLRAENMLNLRGLGMAGRSG